MFVPNLNGWSCREYEVLEYEHDIDGFSLHIMHGAFWTSAEKSEWALKKLVKDAYMILHNTLARRKDYKSVTGSSTYPLSFCPTWFELFGLSLLYFKNALLFAFSSKIWFSFGLDYFGLSIIYTICYL